MSTLAHYFNSKIILILCGVFLVPILIFPPIFTHGFVLTGFLAGYLESKLEIPSLLNLIWGSKATMSYLSLRYDFPILHTNHDGMVILLINIFYITILALIFYRLLKKYEKLSSGKAALISLVSSGIIIYFIGAIAIILNLKNILTPSTCCSLW
jgi:hypothetical protein